MRRAFEDEVKKHHFDLRRARHDSSHYFHIITQSHWEIWQVAWKLGRGYDRSEEEKPATPVRRTRTR